MSPAKVHTDMNREGSVPSGEIVNSGLGLSLVRGHMAILMEQDLESAFVLIFFRGYGNLDDQEQMIERLGTCR